MTRWTVEYGDDVEMDTGEGHTDRVDAEVAKENLYLTSTAYFLKLILFLFHLIEEL